MLHPNIRKLPFLIRSIERKSGNFREEDKPEGDLWTICGGKVKHDPGAVCQDLSSKEGDQVDFFFWKRRIHAGEV